MQVSAIIKAYKLLSATEFYLPTAKPKHKSLTGMDDCKPVENLQISNSSKRRFTDNQLKSLESMFTSESRPGSKTKQQIADQLGLHPRQVAVWFQNRRARTKSKQTERDYSILKAHYDTLTSQFEVLRKENESLIIEVQRLRELQGTPKDSTSESAQATCSSNGESISLSSLTKHVAQQEDYNNDKIICETTSDGFKNLEHETDHQENFDMIESADGSLVLSRNHSILETNYLIEHDCISDWWEFWT